MTVHQHAGPNSQVVQHNHHHGEVDHSHSSQVPARRWAWVSPDEVNRKAKELAAEFEAAEACPGGEEAHWAHLDINGECPWCAAITK